MCHTIARSHTQHEVAYFFFSFALNILEMSFMSAQRCCYDYTEKFLMSFLFQKKLPQSVHGDNGQEIF